MPSALAGVLLFGCFSLITFLGNAWWMPRMPGPPFILPGILALCGLLIFRPLRLPNMPKAFIPGPLIAPLLALSVFGLLFLLRQAIPTEGDGVELLQRIQAIENQPGFFLSGFNSPLSSWLCVLVHRQAHALLGWNAALSIAVLSCLCGTAAFFLLRDISQRLFPDRISDQRLFLLISCTSGCFAVFFGHIEFYAFLFLSIIFFARQSLLFLHGKAPFWSTALAIGVGASFHRLALVAIPTLGVLLWQYRGQGKTRIQEALKGSLALVGPMVVAHLLLYNSGVWTDASGSFRILPVLDPHDPHFQYAWLGLDHLESLLGFLVVGSWAGLVLCVTGLGKLGWKALSKNPLLRVFGTLALCTQMWALLWNPDLGPALDWDLFSLTGLTWLFVGLGIFSELDLSNTHTRTLLRLALWTGLFQQIIWIWSHHQGI